MTQSRTRIRIRFTKQEELRWISHRDLARLWERLLRRAEVLLAFSQGFHPKPKISFPSALALGVEALDEVVEMEVLGAVSLAELQTRLEEQLPPGMKLLSLEFPATKARFLGSTFRIELPQDLVESTRDRIAQILQSEIIEVERDAKPVRCPVRQQFFELRLEGSDFYFTLPSVEVGTALRPSELLQVLGLEMLLESGSILQRVQVHLAEDSGIPGLPAAGQPLSHQPECETSSSLPIGNTQEQD